MGWRIVVVSSRSKLELKNNFLVIRAESVKRVHIDEISVLLIENTGSAVTVSLLETLWSKKIAVIFCDRKKSPGAQLIPYYGCHDCSHKLDNQLRWDRDFTDEVWAEIVRHKIRNQAKVLYLEEKPEFGKMLDEYASDVTAGDKTNREGHAAKVYFNALFGHEFSRSDECTINYCLNYGYAILMSTVSREIVSNGCLTQLGIFHSNVYNQFNLSCDLMEPFRPLIDKKVIDLSVQDYDEITPAMKMEIVKTLNESVRIFNVRTTLLNAISIYVRSIIECLDNNNLDYARFCEYEF